MTEPTPRRDLLRLGLLPTWQRVLLLVLFLYGALSYFRATDPYGKQGGGVQLDGFYYYIYLHSLIRDGDLDLDNDYALQGYGVKYERVEATGRRANPFAIGPAILWAPFLLLAHALALLRGWLVDPGQSHNVMSELHQNVTLFGTYLYGCAAVWVCYRLLLDFFAPRLALLTALFLLLGTPLVYYMVSCPSYSHAQSALCYSLFVWAWLSCRGAMTPRRWVLLGALAGLMTLVHPGNAALALLAAGTALGDLWTAARARDGRLLVRALGGPLLALAAALLVFSPQMVVWKVIYGRYLLTPQGEDFMRFTQSMWDSTLLAPRNGLLPHSPILWPALLGLLVLLGRQPALAASALLALAALTLVNGAVYDWWGWGFGARRYTVALPLFGLGLAAMATWLREVALKWQRHVALGAVSILLFILVLVNLQMMREFSEGTLTGAELVPTRESYSLTTKGFLRDLYSRLGNPLSFPASWLFAWRHGVEPERYDKVVGFYFLDENHVGANPHDPKNEDNLDFTRKWPERFLLDGWGEPGTYDGLLARPARRERVRFLLPLNITAGLRLVLRLHPKQPGIRLHPSVNGAPLAPQVLARGWQDVTVEVPAGRIRRGMNVVELLHQIPPGREPEESRDIGRTGVRSPVPIAAVGASTDHGDFADIWVAGERCTPNRRGLNVTAVEPRSGRVLFVRGFDLHLNAANSEALEQFVVGLPRGTIVAMATRDEASRAFDERALHALQLVGAATDLTDKYRQAYAAIGVVGAAPGTALEALRASSRASVRIGPEPPPWRALAWYQHAKLFVQP